MNREGLSKKLSVLVLVIIIIIAVLSRKKGEHERDEILSNYDYTIGWYMGVGFTGDIPSTKYIKFSYKVEGETYSKTVESPEHYYKCKNLDCSDRKYWVIYMPKKPERSMIYLDGYWEADNTPAFPEHELSEFNMVRSPTYNKYE